MGNSIKVMETFPTQEDGDAYIGASMGRITWKGVYNRDVAAEPDTLRWWTSHRCQTSSR